MLKTIIKCSLVTAIMISASNATFLENRELKERSLEDMPLRVSSLFQAVKDDLDETYLKGDLESFLFKTSELKKQYELKEDKLLEKSIAYIYYGEALRLQGKRDLSVLYAKKGYAIIKEMGFGYIKEKNLISRFVVKCLLNSDDKEDNSKASQIAVALTSVTTNEDYQNKLLIFLDLAAHL